MSSIPDAEHDEERPPVANEKHNLLRNTLVTGLSQTAALVAAFVFMPLLVRAFGLVDYGLYVLVSAVGGYAALLDLGIGTAVTKAVASHAERGEPGESVGPIATATIFYCLVGVVVVSAMTLLAVFAPRLFDVSGREVAIVRNLLLVTGAFQIVQWPSATARHVLAGLQRYDVLAVASFASAALNVVATIVVLATGHGPVMLALLSGIVTTAVALALVVAAARLTGLRRLPLASASMPAFSRMLAFSWAVFVVQLSDLLFYQQTDRIVLGVLAGAVAVGLYEASAKVNSLITYLSGLTVSAVVPAAASMEAGERTSALHALFVRGTKYGTAVIAPIALTFAVLAEPLLVAWLGPRFSGQGLVLQVLVLPHVVVAVGLMGDAIVISRGRMGSRVPYILGQAILNVAISALLVPRYGVIGVAIGTAVAHLVDVPIHVRFLLAETRVAFSAWLREIVAPVYPLLIVPAVIAYLLALTPMRATLAGLLGVFAVSVAAYWACFFGIGLSAAERDDLTHVARSLVRPGAEG